MKKLLMIPMDPTQNPVELTIKKWRKFQGHIEVTFPDNQVNYIPENQIKEIKELHGFADNRAARRARRKKS